MKERCQAEIHDSRCNGWATSRDHFTPRCLIKLLRLDKRLLTSEENLIWMNKYCHALKDSTTPLVLLQSRRQLSGRFFRLGDHV